MADKFLKMLHVLMPQIIIGAQILHATGYRYGVQDKETKACCNYLHR